MIMPNKAISYDESLLSKFPYILQTITNNTTDVMELYQNTKSAFKSVNEFLLALDALFIIGRIEYKDGEINIC